MAIPVEIDKTVTLPKIAKKKLHRKRVETDPKAKRASIQCAIHYTTDVMWGNPQNPIIRCDQMRISLWELQWHFLKTDIGTP